MWLSRDCPVPVYVNIFVYVYINITVYIFVIIYIINTTYFIYFKLIYLKEYYIVFLLLKKNERGLRGKQQFEQFTQYQDIFSHFSTFYYKNICFFQTDFVYLVIERLRKNNWRFFNFFEISNYLYKTRLKTLWPL